MSDTEERFNKYADAVEVLQAPTDPYTLMTKTEILTFVDSETLRLQNLLSRIYRMAIRVEQAINEGGPADEIQEWLDDIKENTKEFASV